MSTRGYNSTPGWTAKKVCRSGHGRDLAAFKGTGLQNKSFQDWAEISSTHKMTSVSGPTHYAPNDLHGA